MERKRLGLPEPEQPVLGVRGDEVLVRVVRNADDVLLVHVEGSLEFAGRRGEAVQHEVFADAVDPLAVRRYAARNEVSARTFARCERPISGKTRRLPEIKIFAQGTTKSVVPSWRLP